MSRMTSRKRKTTGRPAASPRAKELTRLGWVRRDAEHLLVVELALSVAVELEPVGLRVLAEHVATALAWEPVLCGVQVLYTQPEHAPAWRALAAVSDEPMRDMLCRIAAVADGCDVEQRELGDVFTPDDLRVLEEARQAESRGEFGEALRLLKTCPRPLRDTWTTELEAIVARGDTFSPALWGRLICSAALRWCHGTERGLQMGHHYATVALRALGAPDDQLDQLAISRAGYDQVVHDALLWDEGGLREYIERDLAPALHSRVPGLAAWPDAQLRVLILVRAQGADAVCADVRTGEEMVIGDAHLAEQHPPGRIFFGRVVAVDGDDRRFFAMLPTICEDADVAVQLAELAADGVEAEGRIDELHRVRDAA